VHERRVLEQMSAWGHVRLTAATAAPTTAETAAKGGAPAAAAVEALTSAVTTAAAAALGTSSLRSQASPSASCDSPQPRFFRQLMAQGHSPEGVYLPVKQAIEENEDANNGHAEGDGFRRRADEDGQSRLLHGLPWAPPAGGRRRLLGLGDVQYPLDGYFLSKSGLYYVQVQLGWNKQPVNLQVDTGSDLLWTRCVCPSCPPPQPTANYTQQQPAGGQQSPSALPPAPPSGPSPSSPPPVVPPSSASLNRATNMATNAGTSSGPGQGLLAGAQMALEVDGSQRPLPSQSHVRGEPSETHAQAQAQAQAQGEGDSRQLVTAAGVGNAVDRGAYAGGDGAEGVGGEGERWNEEEAGQLAVPRDSLMRGTALGSSEAAGEAAGDWPVPRESQAGQQRHSLAAVGDAGAVGSMRSATLESTSFEAQAATTTVGSTPSASPTPPPSAAAGSSEAAAAAPAAGAAGKAASKVQELEGKHLVYWAGNSSSLGGGVCTDAPCTALTQQYALEMPVGCQVRGRVG
ncbi:unnamed protein product, partial [Closterium sp. NIES-54]